MTDASKQPKSAVELAEDIRQHVVPIVSGDDLELPPPVPLGELPWRVFDRTLAEVRNKFADMLPEEAQALIDEAIAMERSSVPENSQDLP